jgi:hypothetical protein
LLCGDDVFHVVFYSVAVIDDGKTFARMHFDCHQLSQRIFEYPIESPARFMPSLGWHALCSPA